MSWIFFHVKSFYHFRFLHFESRDILAIILLLFINFLSVLNLFLIVPSQNDRDFVSKILYHMKRNNLDGNISSQINGHLQVERFHLFHFPEFLFHWGDLFLFGLHLLL